MSGRNIGGLVVDGHAPRHARSFDRTVARRRCGDRRSRRGGARRRNRLFRARMRVHARLRAAMRCHARRPSGGDARRQPSRSRGDALCRRVRPYARRRRLDRRNPIFCHGLGANAGGRAASGRGALLRDVAWLGRPADRRRRLHGGRLCRRARGALRNLLWRHALRQDRAAGRLAAAGRPEFPGRSPPAIRSLDAARRERAASRKSRSALA